MVGWVWYFSDGIKTAVQHAIRCQWTADDTAFTASLGGIVGAVALIGYCVWLIATAG